MDMSVSMISGVATPAIGSSREATVGGGIGGGVAGGGDGGDGGGGDGGGVE
jgi:hypothetical protein